MNRIACFSLHEFAFLILSSCCSVNPRSHKSARVRALPSARLLLFFCAFLLCFFLNHIIKFLFCKPRYLDNILRGKFFFSIASAAFCCFLSGLKASRLPWPHPGYLQQPFSMPMDLDTFDSPSTLPADIKKRECFLIIDELNLYHSRIRMVLTRFTY